MTAFVKAGVTSGAKTLEGHWYTSPDVFAREQETIFSKQWVCVGREEALVAPGDFMLADVAGESLIVVRDGSDALHAFFNVCRHRGTRLCESQSGRFTGSIQCPYHAWTYALDGRLMAARNMSEVAGFDANEYPLKQVRLATWDGFVFVNLSSHAGEFESVYAPLLTRFARWSIGSLRIARTLSYTLECNWKLIFQNYSECYHCPLVHPQLEKLSPSDSGRNDLTEGPFIGGYSDLRQGASLTTSGATRRPPLPGLTPEDVARSYYYTIFPTMLLSLHSDYVMVHYVRPVSPERTHVDCQFLFDPATMASANFDPSDAVGFWNTTNRQDWHVNELTYNGVCSRSYTPGPYAHAEGLLAAFDQHYLSVMNA